MAMGIRLPVGIDSFEKLRRSGAYYVDKTALLYELLAGKVNEVTLFTRPRRFGKTLAMSMMECFFDISADSRSLFEGLSIMEHEGLCREWMNRYPVVFLTLKDVEGEDFQEAYEMLQYVLASLLKKHEYLEMSQKASPADAAAFHRLLFQEGGRADIKGSLDLLMRMLKAHYGMPVILLVDEYDVPLAKAEERGYYERMLLLVKGMLGLALKSNDSLKFAVLTGCLRIAKESIFTDVNHFAVYSVLGSAFSDSFGFLETEVERLLSDAGMPQHAGIVKEWYDGYLFGKKQIYCPWDVINYVSDAMDEPEAPPLNYWANTSSNSIIRRMVGQSEYPVNRKCEKLLNGGSILQEITEELTYGQLYASEKNLWSVMVMTGYLTRAGGSAAGDAVFLKIPNMEIASIFQDTVMEWFRDSLAVESRAELFAAMWSGDAQTASKLISELLWKTISFHDYNEDYYHAFIAGIFTGAGYETESNREHGLGRADLVMIDAPNKRVIVIEAKKSAAEKDMEKECAKALEQIRNKKYAQEFYRDYEEVLCYGISFFQKKCIVKRMEE